ncbi:RHS repeat-associated core domain-containing protein [Dyella sp. M7H15-1]|uniref:RHS repeat-associated core domain-containing protein n=1 Tax=Dyella sp. M7H15-1 TaxID=2501295 RepID=UPI0013E8EF3E|nr:RHS repeat-associated core domain-containing protein [Dyella sp. M7H15-1]
MLYLDGIPVANLDTQGTATSVAYVTADQLSTPRAVADSSGNSIWTWAYQGNAWAEQAPTSNGYTYNFRFPGQYFDAETGLVYNGARYYDPASGRFPQADPAGLRGGINPYVYGLNDPLTYIDPSGLSPPGAPPPIGPFPPEDPGQLPGASDIPGGLPGGPWTPAGPGQLPGDFYGPAQPKGGRAMCRWVPEGNNGEPPYWKTKAPGQKGWDRWNLNGNWQPPEQAHPGNPPPAEPPVEPTPPAEPPVTEPPVTEPPVIEPPIIDPIIP